MTEFRANIEEQAIGWIIRIRDPQFDDWEAFAAWAEDPVKAEAYAELAAVDIDLGEQLTSPSAGQILVANDDEPQGFRKNRRLVLGWAVAAVVVAAVGFAVRPVGPSTYTVATAAGERKSIRLEDGSRIDVNGDTRLILDRQNARYARLEAGEANFSIVHNSRKGFVVQTGGATLMDAGTAFNVTRIGRVTEVAVSEGLVIYNPKSEKLPLVPGRMIHVRDGQRPVLGEVDPHSVASWREGKLIYDGAPFAKVATDLSRNLGVAISVSPELAKRPISAVIQLNGNDSEAIEDIGALLGVEAVRAGLGWRFVVEGNAKH